MGVDPLADLDALSPAELRQQLRELRQQLELARQSEDLRRTQAEARVRASEGRFAQLAQQIGIIAWEVDAQGRYTYVSAASEPVLGYRPDELIGRMHFYDLHPEAGRKAFQTQALAVFARKESFQNLVNAAQTKAGRQVWLSTNGIPLLGADGTLLGYRGSDTDITERKRAEETLRKISTAVEQSPVSIVITDTTGVIEYVNPKFTEVTGYTAAEALGKNPRVLKSGEFPREAYRGLWQQILAGEVWRGEFHNKRKDGQLFWERASISPIRNDQGVVTSFVAVKEDITERKRAEAELQTTNDHLEQATARANAMALRAELASIAKSQFLATMSHEIRTPMNGVIGMTGLLLDTQLSAEQRQYAETVRTSGQALLSLINDILDFSKIEAGKLELESLDFDLGTLLEEFADLLAPRFLGLELEFICAVAPEVPTWLRGDAGRLRQVLLNLAGNAVKFTQRGEVAVRASLVAATPAAVVVRFAVRDTGLGIPVDKQPLLFEKFTQVDAGTTRQYGGTGLGLAISKQLAQLMGGEIGLTSAAGQGSEFWFTARFGRPAAAKPQPPLPAELSAAHILVVDDNATQREVLTTQLRTWGMRVAQAPDGPTALRVLAQAAATGDRFQTALLDLQMPNMDGAALAQAIQADPSLRDLRLVLLTPLGQHGDSPALASLGFAACLTKPTRKAELLRSLLPGTPTAAPPALASPAPLPARPLNTFRLLLAEDNITNQQVAAAFLKKLGLRADTVANGAEALHALETLPYDLVLMDVQMPEMDGLTAAGIIRNQEREIRSGTAAQAGAAAFTLHPASRSPLPIIAMTARAMQGDRETCLAAGMDDYVAKPITLPALASVLEKWLPPEPGPGVAPTAPPPPRPAGTLELPVFDVADMMVRLMDDHDLARVLAAGFVDDLPKCIAALKGDLAAGVVANVERHAHTIKGAASAISGQTLCAVAAEMEQAARAGDLATVTARLPELEAQFARLQTALNDFCKSK
jgi:PAS domain S-box-containing protein